MASKLARQMAYKKRLEEEHREFQERCKYERKSAQQRNLIIDEHRGYSGTTEMRRRKNFSDDVDDDIERQKLEKENMKKVEEKKRRRQEDYEREKEKWLRNKKEYSLRASRFADLKRKRREEKRKMEEARKVLEGDDLWQELDTIIRQNENTLEQLNQYRVCVENIHKSRREKQELENTLTFSVAEGKSSVNCKTEETQDTAEADDELEKIYTRIRELECSIVTLDDALDRYEIDKMRKKTLQVKRRMTETVGSGSQQDCLTSHTVDMFLANSILWEKYKTS